MRVLYGIAIAGLLLGASVAFPLAVAGVDGGEPIDAGGVAAAPTDAGAAAAAAAGPDGGSKSAKARRFWRRHGGPDARLMGEPYRDGGVVTPPIMARPALIRPTAPVPVPPAPPQPPPVTRPEALAALSEFNTCKKIPPGKRIVKMNLKPDAELADLIAWISTITCKPFVLPGHLTAAGKKITIVAPNLMTRDEAYASFLNALDSIGLTVERSSGYLRIIETAKAKSASLPVYGFDGQPAKTGSSSE